MICVQVLAYSLCDAVDILQVDRQPIRDTVTYQIDQDVSYTDKPQNLIFEDIVHKEGLERNLSLLALLGLRTRIVVAVLDRKSVV